MMAVLSARLYGDPGGRMTLVGITGTKGKTTTAHLLAAILQADGRRVGLIGTNGACWPEHRHDLNHTTPESCDLQALRCGWPMTAATPASWRCPALG